MIERASTEFYLRPTKPSKIYWLQPGKQDVGHQPFGAFLGVTEGPGSRMTYIKSIRDRGHNNKGPLLVIAIAITMVGFVVQFVGLRGLHASVILAQMGSTLLMAIVRTCLRTKRIGPDENRLDSTERQLSSYKHQELDSFAFHLEDVESFSLISTAASGPLPSQSSSASSTSSIGSSIQQVRTGTRLVQTRARLAELTSNTDEHPDRAWEDLPIRLAAENLAQTIESTMDVISNWKKSSSDTFSFDLSLVCQSRKKFVAPKVETYPITLERSDDTFQWRIKDHELEAIIGLRAWSLLKANPNWNQKGLDRLVGLSESEARAEETDLYFQKWIYRHTQARMVSSKTISFPEQMFGFSPDESSNDKDILVVKTDNDLETMVAQDIYIQFLSSALEDLQELGGDVKLLPGSQSGYLAYSSRLDELVSCFESGGMGSREDALLCVVPVLKHQGILPQLAGYSGIIRERIDELMANENWAEAFATLRWICERCEGAEFEYSLFELGDLCRRAMIHTEASVQSEGFKQALLVIQGDPRANLLKNSKTSRRDGWMSNRPEDWRTFSLQLGWVAWHIARNHCDKRSIQGDLDSLGINEQSIPSGKVNNSVDQGARGQQIALLWLTDSDEKLSHRELEKLYNGELPGSDEMLAFDWACQNDHYALINWLLARWLQFEKRYPGFIYHFLLWAAERRYRVAITSLRRHGVNLDKQAYQDGATALINRVAVADLPAICELLETGADVNGTAARGATPLITASYAGDIDIVRLLLRRGATVHAHDDDGLTPLVWSAVQNHVGVAQTLLEHGAHVNLGTFGGDTPLIAAAADNHAEMAKFLLSRGADVDAQTQEGCTALMLATRNGGTETMRVLLEHGANVRGRISDGPTALDWARGMHYLEGIQLLEAAMAREPGV
ncbi:ankyrin repeat domain-containing protein [Aspergillus melleus]|uniref:ankyrin repeat domain-containing protein n=1 Tax=Aspergillus melleus TaxID=138277 RepID=UPI001E8DED12|nr:uncharacterized protein LDX57_004525 [Aspergillus melleus]KAH8426795.1 hypothetical protein LDX57_004525 [Aspergillus melleus]